MTNVPQGLNSSDPAVVNFGATAGGHMACQRVAAADMADAREDAMPAADEPRVPSPPLAQRGIAEVSGGPGIVLRLRCRASLVLEQRTGGALLRGLSLGDPCGPVPWSWSPPPRAACPGWGRPPSSSPLLWGEAPVPRAGGQKLVGCPLDLAPSPLFPRRTETGLCTEMAAGGGGGSRKVK